MTVRQWNYYNNGITILCDEAVRRSHKGRDILQVSNPQVINGQQTTRTLADHPDLARKASVLVKVVRVPRTIGDGGNGFEDLVSRIVAGTNWQNAIKPSDLMSNDRTQIDLQRSLRKMGYLYVRKRQTKGEAKRLAGGKHYHIIKKEEFAQAVAACDLDPVIARTAREKLFEEALYKKVFPHADPDFYLTRFWLMREVKYWARGSKQKNYARWLILRFIWSRVAPMVRSRKNARAFRLQCEKRTGDLVWPLGDTIDRAYKEALSFYRKSRGTGENAVDASTFFKSKRGRHRDFETYWTEGGRSKAPFDRLMAKVSKAIDEFGG